MFSVGMGGLYASESRVSVEAQHTTISIEVSGGKMAPIDVEWFSGRRVLRPYIGTPADRCYHLRAMADRFDKFTERARRVLTLAQEEALRFNHNYIGTEHFFWGLFVKSEVWQRRLSRI